MKPDFRSCSAPEGQESNASLLRPLPSARPLVSIIIPCFNGEAYVGEAIESAVSQSYRAIETIVVDDGSTDRSREIIRSFGRRIKLKVGATHGPGAARNAGMAASKGEYIKFLDADDWLVPGCIERQVKQLAARRHDEFVVGRSFRYEQRTGDIVPHSLRDRMPAGTVTMEAFILDAPLSAAPLHRRKLLQDVGGFDERLRYREDFDLLIRLLIAGAKPVFTPEVAMFYRNHESSGRVSMQEPIKRGEIALQMFRKHLSLLEDRGGREPSHDFAAGMAMAIWQSGRNMLRAGMKDLSLEYFSLARCCSPSRHVRGKPLYSALNSVLGPVGTEHVLGRAKGLVLPVSSTVRDQVQC